MASNSKIEWTDHTVNFWWGCTKVSPACARCYAETMAKQRSKMFFGFLVEWGEGKPRGERLKKAAAECWALDTQAMRKGVRYRVFVNSMSDWLDDEVPKEWLAKLLETVHRCKHLDFQLLTKRPENWRQRIEAVRNFLTVRDGATAIWLNDWLPPSAWVPGCAKTADGLIHKQVVPPANVWIGTTVESQEWADRRIPELLKIPSAVRFLSCEPMVGAVDLKQWLDPELSCHFNGDKAALEDEAFVKAFSTMVKLAVRQDAGLHWIIAGGESGGQARALHPGWVKSLRDQCQAAGVPFFFKQWGEWVPQGEKMAAEIAETKLLKGHKHEDGTLMLRVGKEKAGAFLDGVEWREMPTIGSAPGAPGHGTRASAAPCETGGSARG